MVSALVLYYLPMSLLWDARLKWVYLSVLTQTLSTFLLTVPRRFLCCSSLCSVVIGGTVGLVSSVGRAPDLQSGGRGFESCIGHTFSSLVYFNGDEVNW